jgi:broad specificity phosphatase PhoE
LWRADSDIVAPQSIYTSPLRRCLRTTSLGFESLLEGVMPTIKETLRERLGVHTCDQRSSRSWIANDFPYFKIEAGFAEEDNVWRADRRESLDEHIVRISALLSEIFAHDESEVVALTMHSGAIMALFSAVGWKKVPVAAGAVYPLLVCAEGEGK